MKIREISCSATLAEHDDRAGLMACDLARQAPECLAPSTEALKTKNDQIAEAEQEAFAAMDPGNPADLGPGLGSNSDQGLGRQASGKRCCEAFAYYSLDLNQLRRTFSGTPRVRGRYYRKQKNPPHPGENRWHRQHRS